MVIKLAEFRVYAITIFPIELTCSRIHRNVYLSSWLLLLAMAYLVKHKIQGHTYVYEAENYWDPEKKQSRQKRRYLGVWDEASGQIIPKTAERDVKTTKSFGPAYLLSSVANEIDLRKKLSESFGKDGDLILTIAMSKLLHQTSLKNLHHVLDD